MCGAASTKRWAKRNSDKVRNGHLVSNLRKYGLTIENFDTMLKNQMGLCAICLEKPRSKRGFHVDHDHSCCPEQAQSCGNCVRGLVCHHCNLIMANASDSVERLADVIVYLLDWENSQEDVSSKYASP